MLEVSKVLKESIITVLGIEKWLKNTIDTEV
jgi:hypothetical protein